MKSLIFKVPLFNGLSEMTNGIFIFAIGFVVVFLLTRYRYYFKGVFLALTTPGPPAIPLLGNSFILTDNDQMLDLGMKSVERYGSIFRIWISILPVFVITEPDHIRLVIGSSRNSEKNVFYDIMKNFIGEGILIANGDKWKTNRKLMQPFFHVNVLKEFCHTFENRAQQLVRQLQNKQDLNITAYINDSVIRILYDVVLGTCPEENITYSPFRKGRVLMSYRATRPWLLLDGIFRFTSTGNSEVLHNQELRLYIKQILETKRKYFDLTCSKPHCLLEMMMVLSRNNPEFTDEDIIKEACMFMLAGQESVATALTFTLYLLAKHQDVQDKVMTELIPIFAKNGQKITVQELSQMVYLEQSIKETLRLYPALPLLARKLTTDLVMNNRTFPKGTNIVLSPFLTHRLPQIYKRPLEFNPDRFSSTNQIKLHPYAYFPFSQGPRNCIGYKFALLEMKMIIAYLLNSYHLGLRPGFEEINLAYRVPALRARRGIHLKLRVRTSVE